MDKRSRLLRLKRLKRTKKATPKTTSGRVTKVQDDSESFECPSEYKEWPELGVPPQIVKALVGMSFVSPTEIQRQVIPIALKRDADIVGAAETGSGKTLAFGIPVLNYILSECPPTPYSQKKSASKKRKFEKEQVHLMDNGSKMVDINEVVFVEDEFKENKEEKEPREKQRWKRKREMEEESEEMSEIDEDEIDEEQSISCLVASDDFIPDHLFELSLRTGKRAGELLEEVPVDPLAGDGMVALILTPTRELAMQIKSHMDAVAKYTGIQVCSVIGGMSTQKQERLLKLGPQVVIATPGRLWKMIKEDENPHLNNFKMLKYLILDEADRMVEHGHFTELSLILERISSDTHPSNYHTMVFSATLTLPRQRAKGRKAWRVHSGGQSIETLVSKAGLSEDAIIIDLSTKKGTVDRLTESKIMCTSDEKDVYLYYCLMACKGRTLVFTNSLDCLNRLKSLLEALHLKPLPLHARMQQRQRLKNLDRFTSDPNGLMVASDVAARGLDIPQVEHVIHYQTPKNSEVYVHRSGRTARGKAEGTTALLVAPEDLQGYRNICKTLNREEELDNFPVDVALLKPLRERVQLARKLDSQEHRFQRSSRSESWLEQTAKAMDIMLDEQLEDEKEEKVRERSEQKATLKSLRVQLNHLLSQDLIPRDVSFNYPSMSSLAHHKNSIATSVEKLKRNKRAKRS